MEKRVSKIVGPSDLTIETGKLAKLADGSVTVRSGDTIILVAAVSATSVKEGQDFFPLTVDYREKAAAAGKIPGGYFKREGRPSEKETLTSRMTDRPLRPLFPKGYFYDTQVISVLLSADGENNEIRVLKREDGTVVGSFGRNGRNAGQFHWIHAMAVDAKGNVYTAEVDTGKRIQKFKLTSDALR